jgi:peptide/nickel transport system substrate-binding protein
MAKHGGHDDSVDALGDPGRLEDGSLGLTREELIRRGIAGGALVAGTGVLAGWGAAGSKSTASAGSRHSDAQLSGGRLRVACSVGSAPTLDPQRMQGESETARGWAVYDLLSDFDARGKPFSKLAKEFVPNKAGDVWIIRLRPGVEWHDGKDLTADDVIYSIRRHFAEKLEGAGVIPFVDPNQISKVDKLTVRLKLNAPVGDLLSPFAYKNLLIIQDGTTNFNHPIGTGPFKFVSWDKTTDDGLYVRNPNSWRVAGTSKPFIDELEIIGIGEPSARLNALLGGQVDAIQGVEYAQAKVVTSRGKKILNAPSAWWPGICMQIDSAPFRDKRVREAFRLIPDRKQMVDVALLGFGRVGNDLFGWTDPMYAADLPQRKQDLEKARFLLKRARRDDVRITLYTSDIAPGAVNVALLFAQQAKKVGVTVKVNKGPSATYYDDAWLKHPFFMTSWATRPLDSQLLLTLTKQAPYNETHWYNKRFARMTAKARATPNFDKRRQLYHDAQEMLWNDGGYIVWGFTNIVDAYAANVRGLVPSRIRALGHYNFENVSLA